MRIEKLENDKEFVFALIRYMRGIFILLVISSGLYLIIGRFNRIMIDLVVDYNLIMILGVCLSMVIHEFAHFLALRICRVNQIGIDTSVFRVSVYTLEDIKGKRLMFVALAGVLSTTCVGLLIMIINSFVESSVIKVIMWIYYIHLINILPFFGDGRMLMKSWITMK